MKKTKEEVIIEGLENEVDFWKSQYYKLVDIICETKKVSDDTMKHINKILGY